KRTWIGLASAALMRGTLSVNQASPVALSKPIQVRFMLEPLARLVVVLHRRLPCSGMASASLEHPAQLLAAILMPKSVLVRLTHWHPTFTAAAASAIASKDACSARRPTRASLDGLDSSLPKYNSAPSCYAHPY